MDSQLSNTLNLMRWLAALMVVVGHLRSFLFVEYNFVENKTIFIKIFYFITGFGHQAVMIFFVLSGYLVGGAVIRKYREKKLNNEYVKSYFIKRFLRIYIVLIPALIIGFTLDNYGYNLFPQLYINAYNISAMNFNAYENNNIQILLGNIFNLQTIFVETLGTNGPLWSLANEWSYYILCILLFINKWTRLLFLSIIVVLVILNDNIVFYSIIWILGSGIVLIKKQLLNKYIALFLLLCTLIISRKIHGFYIDLTLASIIGLFINSLQFTIQNAKYFKKTNHIMAEFSYSVYLFHFPFFVFFISYFHREDINLLQLQPSLINFVFYFVILICIYIYSYILYIFFEKNTQKIQTFFIKKMDNF